MSQTPTPRPAVLVVDDEPEIREFLEEMLKEEGFEVCTAPSGEAALDHLSSGKPAHIVLMDVMMGGISGIEAAKRIRQMRPGLPVVLISGAAPPMEEERRTTPVGRAAPPVGPEPPPEAAAFFAKPLDMKRLISEIRALL